MVVWVRVNGNMLENLQNKLFYILKESIRLVAPLPSEGSSTSVKA